MATFKIRHLLSGSHIINAAGSLETGTESCSTAKAHIIIHIALTRAIVIINIVTSVTIAITADNAAIGPPLLRMYMMDCVALLVYMAVHRRFALMPTLILKRKSLPSHKAYTMYPASVPSTASMYVPFLNPELMVMLIHLAVAIVDHRPGAQQTD